MNKNLITREGKERFEQELRHLIEVEQPKNLEDLAAARAQGDLSENADYDAARKKQGEIEARIREIEEILGNCEVIESTQVSTKLVDFGNTVTILDLDTEETETYKIVNTIEVVNVDDNNISVESPLAKAITGHQIGDIVTVDGPIKYSVKIIEIK
jgi:transcription elongation factor GreA